MIILVITVSFQLDVISVCDFFDNWQQSCLTSPAASQEQAENINGHQLLNHPLSVGTHGLNTSVLVVKLQADWCSTSAVVAALFHLI